MADNNFLPCIQFVDLPAKLQNVIAALFSYGFSILAHVWAGGIFTQAFINGYFFFSS